MSYQNICTKKYERDCLERWEAIKPELPKAGVILDIGCAEGYFLKRIAEETNLLAVGVEKHAGRVKTHSRWLTDYHKGKVISCHNNFPTTLAQRINATPEWVDGVLLLSVLHWINNDDFLKAICSFTGKVFVEIPNLDDYSATGQRFMKRIRGYGSEESYFKQVSGRSVRLLKRVKAHTASYRNLWVLEGPVKRTTRLPHVLYAGNNPRNFRQTFNGTIRFDNRKGYVWIPGINLATLSKLNITYPKQSWWESKVKESIKAIDYPVKGDLRIHNLIISRDKFNWIDLQHQGHPMTIYEDIKGLVHDI